MPKTSEKNVTAAKPAGPTPVVFILGIVALLAALVPVFMLARAQFTGEAPPGCGPGSGCARASMSDWGSVPGLGWPTAHVGTAWFAAALVFWILARGRLDGAMRWVVRLSALASVVLLIVMMIGDYYCKYCVISHIANLVFVAIVEISCPRPRAGAARGGAGGHWLGFAVAAIGVTATLAVLQSRYDARIAQLDEDEIDASVAAVVGAGGDTAPPAGEPFTGRYRIGPEEAPLRLVIISDYQCPDCQRIEKEVRQILAQRGDVSFSAKHFPFCIDCNYVAQRANYNPHKNACWAARAAETAGMLGGNDGFWQMHEWLFDGGGRFTDATLPAAIESMGFDSGEFLRVMQSPETLAPVQKDIAEADGLGLRQTPMIFVNGVEIRGWRAKNGLSRALDRIAATNPPARSAALDRPPAALQKFVDDWAAQPVREMPAGDRWTIGPADAKAKFVVWQDLQTDHIREFDKRLQPLLASGLSVSYTFRHYPIDTDCNPSSPRTVNPSACDAARCAEAAGLVGGNEGFFAAYRWLVDNIESFSIEDFLLAAPAFGLDPDAITVALDDPRVGEAIASDGAAGKSLGLTGVPFVHVNGQKIPFWNSGDRPIMEEIAKEAIKKASAP